MSGCVRECAEAQSKDFGLIATDKGWNSESAQEERKHAAEADDQVFIGGNGGMKPRHAQLFAQDVPPTKVVRIIDRYVSRCWNTLAEARMLIGQLMFYIRTADKLQRTAPWVESFEGGIEKLRRILIDDELGICKDLDAEMDSLIGTYEDEWKRAVQDPDLRKQFRQFVNTVGCPSQLTQVEPKADR